MELDLGKSGYRVLGCAESHRGREGDTGFFCGVVMRADGRVEAVEFSLVTVGGLDATDAVLDLWSTTGEDVQAVVVSGLAVAWYNVVDLERLHREIERPVVCVTYEESEGLEESLEREFSGEALESRLEPYERQSDREAVELSAGETVYVRAEGIEDDEARRFVDDLTTHGKKPEPVRVAGLAARGALDHVEAVS